MTHEGADLELEALATGGPAEGLSDKRRYICELRDVPHEEDECGLELNEKPYDF